MTVQWQFNGNPMAIQWQSNNNGDGSGFSNSCDLVLEGAIAQYLIAVVTGDTVTFASG